MWVALVIVQRAVDHVHDGGDELKRFCIHRHRLAQTNIHHKSPASYGHLHHQLHRNVDSKPSIQLQSGLFGVFFDHEHEFEQKVLPWYLFRHTTVKKQMVNALQKSSVRHLKLSTLKLQAAIGDL